jgi:hypothetical protein
MSIPALNMMNWSIVIVYIYVSSFNNYKVYINSINITNIYIVNDEEISSSQSREGDDGKYYKKMYWDLIDNLRKIVGNVDTTSKIISK